MSHVRLNLPYAERIGESNRTDNIQLGVRFSVSECFFDYLLVCYRLF